MERAVFFYVKPEYGGIGDISELLKVRGVLGKSLTTKYSQKSMVRFHDKHESVLSDLFKILVIESY